MVKINRLNVDLHHGFQTFLDLCSFDLVRHVQVCLLNAAIEQILHIPMQPGPQSAIKCEVGCMMYCSHDAKMRVTTIGTGMQSPP